MLQIKECLKQIQVKVTFQHPWFLSDISFWYFFDKYNQAAEKKEENTNVKMFFKRYKAPLIIPSD